MNLILKENEPKVKLREFCVFQKYASANYGAENYGHQVKLFSVKHAMEKRAFLLI